ncbi:MAG: hypothetical protein JSR80_03565 [Verrucomicrobia bacterium]|nr:hypothetical protein [Verrucomicrobiota bacterium]
MSISGASNPSDAVTQSQLQGVSGTPSSKNTEDALMAYLMDLMHTEGQSLNTIVNKALAGQETLLGYVGGISAGLSANFNTKNPQALRELEQALDKFGHSYYALQQAFIHGKLKDFPAPVQAWAKQIFASPPTPLSKDMAASYQALENYQKDPTQKNLAAMKEAFQTMQGLGQSTDLQTKDAFDEFQNTTQTLNSSLSSMVQSIGNDAQNMLNMVQEYTNFATKEAQRLSSIMSDIIKRTN